jgi:hypothetical protein
VKGLRYLLARKILRRKAGDLIAALSYTIDSNKKDRCKQAKSSKRMAYFKTLNLNKSLGKGAENGFLCLWINYPQAAVKVIHTPKYGG